MRNSWIEWQLGEIMKIMNFHDFLGKIDQKFMDIHAWPEIEFSQWLEISPEIQGISKSDLSEHSTFSKNFIMDIMGMLWDLPIKCRDFIMDIMGFNCQPLEIHGDSPSWVSKNGGEIHPCPHGGLVHDGLVGFESSNNSLGIFLPMLKQRMVFLCDFLWWKKRFQDSMRLVFQKSSMLRFGDDLASFFWGDRLPDMTGKRVEDLFWATQHPKFSGHQWCGVHVQGIGSRCSMTIGREHRTSRNSRSRVDFLKTGIETYVLDSASSYTIYTGI